MTTQYVDSIGEGRVWSGEEAMQLGLVDTLGGIEVAIAIAADRAGLEKYRIVELPYEKDFFTKLLEEFSGREETKILERELGAYFPALQQIKQMLKTKDIQARLPFIFYLN